MRVFFAAQTSRSAAAAAAVFTAFSFTACATRESTPAPTSAGVATIDRLGYSHDAFTRAIAKQKLDSKPQEVTADSVPVYLVNLVDDLELLAWKYNESAWIAVKPPVARTSPREPKEWKLALTDRPVGWQKIGVIPKGTTYTITGRFRIASAGTAADIPTGRGVIGQQRKELVLFMGRPQKTYPARPPTKSKPATSKPAAAAANALTVGRNVACLTPLG